LDTQWLQEVESCQDQQLKEDMNETLVDVNGEEVRRLETQLAKCSESVGADLLLYLAAVVEVARTATPEVGQYEELEKYIRCKISTLQVEHSFKVNEARSIVNIIRMLTIVSLPAICRRIVEWWEGQEFLFADLGRDFSQLLNDEIVNPFHEMISFAVKGSQDEVNCNLEVMQAVAETMLREEFRRNVRLYGAFRPLRDVLRNDLNLPNGPIHDKMVAFLTSVSVEIRHYAHVMRLVRGACGDMALHLRNMSTASARCAVKDSSQRGGYIEMVPKEFAVIQELLDFSAPLDFEVTKNSATEALHRSISSDRQDVNNVQPQEPTISISLDLQTMEPTVPLVVPLNRAKIEQVNVAHAKSGDKDLVVGSPPMEALPQRVDDWIDVSSPQFTQLQSPQRVISSGVADAPPPPPDAASTSSTTSTQKKLAKKLTVDNFASQAGMRPSDIEFLVQRDLLPSQNLTKIGIRLPESALASLDAVLVKLADISLSSEGATEQGLRVMVRGIDEVEVVVGADWENICRTKQSLSALELASQLFVRLENLPYLHKQGLLELQYGEDGPLITTAEEIELDRCRAKQSSVAGMVERLKKELASEEAVQDVMECVGVEETDLVDTLQTLGHDAIVYEGSFRLLESGLQAIMAEWNV